MSLTRAVDARIRTLYLQGKVQGGVYSQVGHEAISVGSAYALERDDVIMPMHRDLGAHITRGLEPSLILAQILARSSGYTQGKDNALHIGHAALRILPQISMLGTQIPVTVGAALASKQHRDGRVALTYAGDGTISIGDFHEGLNFAAVLRLPFILIVENNQYAYSTPTTKQYATPTIAERARGYGIPGERVDGNDALAVYFATREAVTRARAGLGPTLLEAVTMRMRGHSENDRAEYVPSEMLDEWRRRDPLDALARRLIGEGILSDDERRNLDQRLVDDVAAAAEWAESQPLPDPATALTDVYAGGEPSAGPSDRKTAGPTEKRA